MNKVEENNKRRDAIVKKIRLVKNTEAEEKASAILDQYLKDNHKNKTPERSFILSLIYQLTVPADIETIHGLVEEHYGHLSKTTVYYTLDLLQAANLVTRIELIENGPAFFEKTIGTEPHGYTVCKNCGSVKIFSLDHIKEEASKMPSTGFRIDNITFIIHGTCRSCLKKHSKPKKVTKTKKNKKQINQ